MLLKHIVKKTLKVAQWPEATAYDILELKFKSFCTCTE